MRVLLTGAAGFIGQHIGAAVAAAGHDVIGLDMLLPQAHGPAAELPPGVVRADVRVPAELDPLLVDVDVVCHQAAMVGNGVDAQDIPDYAAHNDYGTAILLAAMARAKVTNLVLASSMVVYGDGRYTCPVDGDVSPAVRREDDLRNGRFDPRCPHCVGPVSWHPIAESTVFAPRTSYAASKVAQEHYAAAWSILESARCVALRYHNVYGPGMPADTPYAGVAAIFRSALARGEAPTVFEDGQQIRDFVHVHDVARANAAVRLTQDKVCLLVGGTSLHEVLGGIGVRPDGKKELIALADGHRESTESWADLLRSAKRRGMRAPVLAAGDGAL
ncbi:MAG TPA: NAD-dependent epimerase/dehydratase family protein, partial [Aeromicrobium sp.]|nr:NAD-dependent epimerase/dehydratase family protein [Aeromicrobium sp.]